ncbi:hypothetical protein RRG08_060684 [Elysia crispata]|uniref:Uncharacterized protein n=1 Tax=Elysia crispata TaxID=231223 RepID=A0AAE0YRI4_9GAST|nr:hypothetical protein RRG08_060684 [Elysia crispata]
MRIDAKFCRIFPHERRGLTQVDTRVVFVKCRAHFVVIYSAVGSLHQCKTKSAAKFLGQNSESGATCLTGSHTERSGQVSGNQYLRYCFQM